MSTLTTDQAKAYYDRYGARQDSQAYYEDIAFGILAKQGAFENADSVFEFGCGTGRFASQLFSTRFSATSRYYALDISRTMVGVALKRLRPWKDRVSIAVSDGAPKIPANDNTLDRVIATFVLDLLPTEDIEAFIAEAHRALKPDGLLCLASLNGGKTLSTRVTSLLWNTAFKLNPFQVGGCRAVSLPSFLPNNQWQVNHQEARSSWGVSFNTVVAGPK